MVLAEALSATSSHNFQHSVLYLSLPRPLHLWLGTLSHILIFLYCTFLGYLLNLQASQKPSKKWPSAATLMSTTEQYRLLGIQTTLLGLGHHSWTKPQIRLVLDHYRWKYQAITTTKLNLMHELHLLVQE